MKKEMLVMPALNIPLAGGRRAEGGGGGGRRDAAPRRSSSVPTAADVSPIDAPRRFIVIL